MDKLAAVASVTLAAAIAGCASETLPPAASSSDPILADGAHDSRNSLDWAGSYRGVLPCADCEGIETVVNLSRDGSFREHTRYLGKDGPDFSRRGVFAWSDDGSTVTLAGDPPFPYRVGENHLTRLALDGSAVAGALASRYVLTKVSPQITGWQWELVELRGQPVTALERKPFIVLHAGDSRVTGFGGCNSLTGGYTLDEAVARIRFERMASTLRACVTGMDTEQALQEALQTADNYSLSGYQLTLNKARMAPLARFEATFPQ